MKSCAPKLALRSFPVHPVCFALLPVLMLYAANMGELYLSELWLPAGLLLGAGLAVWGIGVRVARDRTRGAVLASVFWIGFFSCGPGHRMIALASPLEETLYLLLYGVLVLAVAAVVATTRRPLVHLSGALNVIGVGLVAFQVLTIASYEWSRLRPPPSGTPSRIQAREVARGALPHIFFIVLDGYAREDVLRESYGYDNRPFLDSLRRQGFQIASNSHSNYCQTLLSLPSCLNLDYLDELGGRGKPQAGNLHPLFQLMRANRTRTLLQEQGYDFVAFPTGYGGTELPEAALHSPPQRRGRLSDFQTALLVNTPLARTGLPRYTDSDHVRAETILYTFAHLPFVARSRRPTFVFAHIVSPHPPFLFRRDGTVKEQIGETGLADGDEFQGTQERYVSGYREQVEALNPRVEAVVRDILSQAQRPTAIILMSDHGPASRLRWAHPDANDLRERFSTLVAVRLPEGNPAPLDDHITTVNVLRFVLSQGLGARLSPLPSRMYYSHFRTPYQFVPLTEAGGRFRPLGSDPETRSPGHD